MAYNPKSILVTGGAGFIGCHYVMEHLKHYPTDKIIVLDKLTYAANINSLESVINNENLVFIQGDICDSVLLQDILAQYAIDTIVHFAAESHVDNSIINPGAFIQANIVGTYVLLQAALDYWKKMGCLDSRLCRFHHISTDEVYGSLQVSDVAFTEETQYKPNSPYSASKASSDHLVRAYYHTYGLPVTISNCSNNFGPFQHDEKLIPAVIRCCIEGKPIPIYGNGENIRDWLFVLDHVTAIDLIIKNGIVGESYNIGGKNEINNINIVRNICNILDKIYSRSDGKSYHELITFVDDRPGHDFRYSINNHKISSQLKWQPRYSFQDALCDTVHFYLKRYKDYEN